MTEVSNDIEKGVESMTTTEKAEDVVNPWEVASSSEKGVDYDKLISIPKFEDYTNSTFHRVASTICTRITVLVDKNIVLASYH
jgi:hypothetical protein